MSNNIRKITNIDQEYLLLIIVFKKIPDLCHLDLCSSLVPKMLPQREVVSVQLHWASAGGGHMVLI